MCKQSHTWNSVQLVTVYRPGAPIRLCLRTVICMQRVEKVAIFMIWALTAVSINIYWIVVKSEWMCTHSYNTNFEGTEQPLMCFFFNNKKKQKCMMRFVFIFCERSATNTFNEICCVLLHSYHDTNEQTPLNN